MTDIDEKRDEMLKIVMTNNVSDDFSSHTYVDLFSAVTYNRINLVQKHIDNKVNVHAENDIALWSAYENGYHDIVKLLLENSTNKNIDYDRMINAALKNDYFLIERLLNKHKLKVFDLKK